MPHRSATRPHARIRQARDKAELSQAAFAETLKVHRSAVSNWESPAGSLPTLENLIRIAHVAHVSFEWLATGRGRMHPTHDDHDVPPMHLTYAQDLHEERLLKDVRALPVAARKALVEFLEAIKRRK